MVLTVAGILILKFYDGDIVQPVYTGVLIASNIYGMAVLVVLLAHGLIKLPLSLW